MSNMIIELIDIYQSASQYFWLGIEATCDKVTSSSISIVKCMGVYNLKNCYLLIICDRKLL